MARWIDERLGLGDLLDGCLDAPAGPPSWARAFTVALGLCLVVAALTGVALGALYAPAGAGAWASVFFSEFQFPGGWLVRSLHTAAAEGSLIFGSLALLLWVFEGRYRHRRDLSFWSLALVLSLGAAFCITGNPLRWDNRGYFGLVTEVNVMSEVPVVGRLLRSLLLGGLLPNNWTLPRLYTLHALVLPGAALALTALGLRAARRAGPVGGDAPYGDGQLARDLLACAATFLALLVAAFLLRAPLEAPADPLASYNARPEWYFQWLYVLRNAVPPSLQGVIATGTPVLLGGVFFALPLLDRDPEAPLRRRIVFLVPVVLGFLGIGALTTAGLVSDRKNPELQKARAAQARLDRRALQIARHAGVAPAGALAMMREDPLLKGEDLFRQHCASCHRLGELGPADGKLAGPSLDGWGSEAWVMEVLDNPDAPHLFGNTPYNGKMPSYTRPPRDPKDAANFTPMPQEQRQAIARFLAGEARGEAPGHNPEGEKLVRQRCTTCHLFRGDTDDAEGLAPELAGWASLSWTRAQIGNPGTNLTYRPVALSPGLEGHMPRFDVQLSSADLDLLTRYVLHEAAKPRTSRTH
jgi:ubiquinol-cytochrome c reductase cytochrome b subunit